jgi:hypothetical protein
LSRCCFFLSGLDWKEKKKRLKFDLNWVKNDLKMIIINNKMIKIY